MATKRTKTESIKTQVDNLIESAQHTATRGWQGNEREVYTMQGAGTFTAEYEITSGWTREQIEEELRRRARRIASRRMMPKGMDDRSNRLQRAMAFIGEHRELVPFLHFYESRKDAKGYTAILNEWRRQGGTVSPIMETLTYGRPINVPYISDLVAQLPYLPKAWRCA